MATTPKTIKCYVYLILDNGERIECEYKIDPDIDDYVFDAIDKAFRNQSDSFYVHEWTELSAELRGHYLEFINMRRVVAINH